VQDVVGLYLNPPDQALVRAPDRLFPLFYQVEIRHRQLL
jgi:hypothetical protein